MPLRTRVRFQQLVQSKLPTRHRADYIWPDGKATMIGFAAQRLMELEVEGLTGAAYGEKSSPPDLAAKWVDLPVPFEIPQNLDAIVCPSGGDLIASCIAIFVAALGRFSTITEIGV